MSMISVARVLEAISRAGTNHLLRPPADASSIDRITALADARLPAQFIDFYERSDGASLAEGNLNLLPLDSPDHYITVLNAADQLRSAGWQNPREGLVFADNGQGDYLAVWIDREIRRSPVIEIGQIFEPGCMGIAGTTFEAFLLGRIAYYAQLCGDPPAVLDDLGVPTALRSEDPDDELWAALRAWADPSLDPRFADPYGARLEADGLRAVIQGAA